MDLLNIFIGIIAVLTGVWFLKHSRKQANEASNPPVIRAASVLSPQVLPDNESIDLKSSLPSSLPSSTYRYWMMYEDGDGNTTTRKFEILDIYEQHKRWYFDALCDISDGQERTFRVDRVQILDVGEGGNMLVEPKQISKWFREKGRSGLY